MIRRVKSALAVTVVTFALFGTPAFADIDSPAGQSFPRREQINQISNKMTNLKGC